MAECTEQRDPGHSPVMGGVSTSFFDPPEIGTIVRNYLGKDDFELLQLHFSESCTGVAPLTSKTGKIRNSVVRRRRDCGRPSSTGIAP